MGTFQKQEYVNWIHSEVATRIDAPEYWKPVINFEDRYAVSTWGRVKNIRSNRILKTRVTKQGALVVTLCKDGHPYVCHIRTMVWKAFVGDVPAGMRVVNKSHSQQDGYLEGLTLMKNADWSRHRGSFGRPVIKLNRQGKVVDLYKTAKEASLKNAYTVSSIAIRCKRDGRSPAADGCDYAYEDDPYSIRRALVRLGVDWRKWEYENS